MKRNRFTDEQIIGILKEHEAGTPVSELCRKHGISDASIYNGSQILRHGRVRSQAAEDAGGREHEAEAALGGCHR